MGLSVVNRDVLPFCNVFDNPAKLIGLNSKALRTAGIQDTQIQKLKQAYRLISNPGPSLEETLEKMTQLGDALVDEWVVFVRGSTRGFCRGGRGA